MKIIEENNNRMVLKESNIISFIFVFVFVALGFLMLFTPSIFVGDPPIWFSIIWLSMTIPIFLIINITTITLDKKENKFIFSEKSIIRNHRDEYNLEGIKEVAFIPRLSGRNEVFDIGFVFQDNHILIVARGNYVIFLTKQLMTEQYLAMKISKFLSIPLKEK